MRNGGCHFAVLVTDSFFFYGKLGEAIPQSFSPSPQIKIPLCQVDLAQNISEWKDVQSNKEDDEYLVFFLKKY